MNKAINLFREQGVVYFFKIGLRKVFPKKIDNYNDIKELFANKSGIEIGGPSGMFKPHGFIPLYNIVSNLDGCNFSNNTLWEGSISAEKSFKYWGDKTGIQIISEATDLAMVKDKTYDFIISSNCLEHIANPLKAVKEWLRVVKNDGLILLVLPNKTYCFDHKRPTTTFDHLLSDFNNDIKESDLTHLDEILELHDLNKDKRAGSFENFKKRSLENEKFRALHHHVFSIALLKQIFAFFELQILLTLENEELIILGKKQQVDRSSAIN